MFNREMGTVDPRNAELQKNRRRQPPVFSCRGCQKYFAPSATYLSVLSVNVTFTLRHSLRNHQGRSWQCYLSPDEDSRVLAAAIQLVQAGRLDRTILHRGRPIRYRVVKSLLLNLGQHQANGNDQPNQIQE